VKKDCTLDLLQMMTDRVKVKFNLPKNKFEVLTGRWCITCMSVTYIDKNYEKLLTFV
jgi:hypothetical protein